MQPTAAAAPLAARSRLAPIDWMRGLVMVLMTVDHASGAVNAGRSFTDAAFAWKPGTPLDPGQFLTRWITHLCAPTFVFLAGASLALMAARRARAGEPERAIDRQMIVRGLIIAALDPLWMSLGFTMWSRFIFQVLYAIGVSMVLMAALRRLPARLLAALGVALIVGVDLVFSSILEAKGGGTGRPDTPVAAALLVTGGLLGRAIIAYPIASWLGMMMLGWAFGRRLVERPERSPAGLLGAAGAAALLLFLVVRGFDGPGNMALHRDSAAVLQWLHVSKYPPSVSYVALELGMMALLLAGFFALTGRPGAARTLEPLRVLGAAAMFFYLLHVHVMELPAHLLGVAGKLGLGATWLLAAACLLVLYLPCLRYGRYKAAHANWFTRIV